MFNFKFEERLYAYKLKLKISTKNLFKIVAENPEFIS